MAFSDDYDKSTPAGSDNPTEGDDKIREFKRATQERLNVEHVFDFDGNEVSHANSGKHTDITCDSIVNGGTLDNTGLATLASAALGGHAVDDLTVKADTIADNDDHLITEAAVKQYVEARPLNGKSNYANYREKQNNGVAGATLAEGWQTCELNEEQANDLDNTFASNAVTIVAAGAGTYMVKAIVTMYLATAYDATSKLRLRDTNGSDTKLTGIAVHTHSSTTAGHHTQVVTMEGRVTLAENDVIELQRYLDASGSRTSVGKASSSGEDEIYSQLELWRVGD